MNSESIFIPGCYRNFPCIVGESLSGYLLRLAEKNGYAGIRDLLKVVDIIATGPFNRLIRQVKTSKAHLATLGAMSVGDVEHLQHYLVRSIGDEAIFWNGCRVDNDAFLVARAQICPVCIRDEHIIRDECDLAPVTVCTHHRVRLVDECPVCRQAIEWNRSFLNKCGKCGSDFGEIQATEVDVVLSNAACDFSALAPFRFSLHGGETQVHSWDTAFKIFKSLALPAKSWVNFDFPTRYVQSMPADVRHSTLSVLAQIRINDSYALLDLNENICSKLLPLSALPRPGLASAHSIRFLHSEIGIPRDVAVAISSPTPVVPLPTGVQVFSDHPPHFTNLREVASFLAVDNATISGLIEVGLIEVPTEEHPGFDIDEIFSAQDYLSTCLLNLAEVSKVVGVPLETHSIFFSELLPGWNKKHPSDARVDISHLVDVQLRLTEKWLEARPPAHSISLKVLAEKSAHPFHVLALALNIVLCGGFTRLAWGPKFDWASLQIDEREAQPLMKKIFAGVE